MGPNTTDTVNTVPPIAAKLLAHNVATELSFASRCSARFTSPRTVVLYTDRQIECDCSRDSVVDDTGVYRVVVVFWAVGTPESTRLRVAGMVKLGLGWGGQCRSKSDLLGDSSS